MFTIEIDGKDALYANNNLNTNMCVKVDGECFPDSEWTDFVIVVLTWWCNEFVTLYPKTKAETCFAFMDGDFCINCRKHKEVMTLEMHTRNGKEIVTSVLADDFAAKLLLATEQAKSIIDSYEDVGTRDYTLMLRAKKKLEKLISNANQNPGARKGKKGATAGYPKIGE